MWWFGGRGAEPQKPICYVNGKRYEMPEGRAEATLLEFLRESGLTGTKLGCGEGGCGACTVMVSHFDGAKVVHRAVNACLAPLYSVEGMHVVTVEGIGNRQDGYHPVQLRLAESHGSQCGFCTPGFVMSMYCLLRNNATPTQLEIEEALAGNLCRCTGYRPILQAFSSFAKTDDAAYSGDALANAHHNGDKMPTPPKAPTAGEMICPGTGKPCNCKGAATKPIEKPVQELTPSGSGLVGKGEPIFPPELKKRAAGALTLAGEKATWHRPTTLKGLLDLKKAHNDAKIIVGNTEVGIEVKFKRMRYPHLVAGTHVPELNKVEVTGEGISIGASVTLTTIMEVFAEQIASRPAHQTRPMKAMREQLHWFAGHQIRNVSGMGGNICTASPISDLNPLHVACGSVFIVQAAGKRERRVSAREFFIGYRKVAMEAGEVLVRVFIPFTKEYEYVQEFKQSHRRDDDIAIVNGGMRVALDPTTWTVKDCGVSFGGVAPFTIVADKVEKALLGNKWDNSTFQAALAACSEQVKLAPQVPGGMGEYRSSLTNSFLFKFFVGCSLKAEEDSKGAFSHAVPPEYESAAAVYHRPASKGAQYWNRTPEKADIVMGAPAMHMAADLQTAGEAQYIDDLPRLPGELFGALVKSTKAHAKLLKVDPGPALAIKGVVRFFGHGDVPGDNHIGAIAHDEECFAESEVTCVGQVIGIVVGETEAAARDGAAAVLVEYEELPAILSIEDAIAANSYFDRPKEASIYCGETKDEHISERVWSQCDHVIEGEHRVGGQEHFYLEPHSSLVVPGENDELVMYSSTQCPTKHQRMAAGVLGLPENKVVCRTKRIGGGFGGKETRSAFVCTAATVPAHILKRPVRIILDRDEDMAISGQRHAFLGKYKCGFSKDGQLVALECDFYNNAGNSLDLSGSIMDRCLMHADSGYKIPNVAFRGHLCKMNLPSNTAYRGFGGPQGFMIGEMVIERVAKTCGLPATQVRELNLYKEGDIAHFGQKLEQCQVIPCWKGVMESSSYQERQARVDAFNKENRWRKRGLAIVPVKFGIAFTAKFLNQAASLVHVYTDGTCLVSHGGVEMGQGLHTKVAQVAAHAFGIPLHCVYIAETATDKIPNASPTAASASSDLYGAATLDACNQILERIKPFRAKAGPGASFKDVVSAAHFERVDLSAHGWNTTPDVTGFPGERPFNYFCYGACASEVEVDCLTGDFQLLRTDICMDVGDAINPTIDVGQVEGGFVQGLGWVAIEELVWGDKEHKWVQPGRLFTCGPGTYKIPSSNDIPQDFHVTLLKDASNHRAVAGSKAVGEPPFLLAGCVLFAIKEACYAARKDAGHDGYFLLDLPATPERVRMACADQFTAPHAGADFRAMQSA